MAGNDISSLAHFYVKQLAATLQTVRQEQKRAGEATVCKRLHF
jgi:hypothetical protein